VKTRDYPTYPPSKSTKRKLHGGPWAGESIGFREDQTELVISAPRPAPAPWPDGGDWAYRIIGRYVVRKVQQKNRVITRVEWETAEEKEALIRRKLRENPFIR
jgi:hypothetical protein